MAITRVFIISLKAKALTPFMSQSALKNHITHCKLFSQGSFLHFLKPVMIFLTLRGIDPFACLFLFIFFINLQLFPRI